MSKPDETTQRRFTNAMRRLKKTPQITLAFRCLQSWARMPSVREEEGVRHCRVCQHNVYDLVGKTEEEIAAAIEASGGDLCGRVMVRPDGRVVSGGCRPIRMGRMKIGKIARR